MPPDHLAARVMKEGSYESIEEVRKDLIELVIYYKTMALTQVVEDWNMPPSSLTSNIGGLLGLFLGASFMSLFEVFEFLSSVLFQFYCGTR